VTAAGRPASRPAKPGRSALVPAGIVAFLIITWFSISEQFGIGLDVGGLIEDITRGGGILVRDDPDPAQRGLLQPNWGFVPRTLEPMLETAQIAVIAAAIGCGIALPITFLVSRVTAPNRPVLTIGRAALSVIRAIPDILYALVFVAATGTGALAGIAALVLFNLGVVVKLLSETVDGVDDGPVEAGRATGATRTQTVRWGVLPQVLPNYVAYSLYSFELNIRAAAVIGIAGAGGIGNLLFTQYRFFNWANVSIIVIELFLLVMTIEFISIWLRRRLV